MFFLLKIESKDKIKKKKKLAIQKQQDILKLYSNELLIMKQQRQTAAKQTEFMINHYYKKYETSTKRWQCVHYHLLDICRKLEEMIHKQKWVTANEHEFIDEAKNYWTEELSFIRDELFLFEQELNDSRYQLNHHLGHVEGIQKGLLFLKREYFRLDLILDQLNNGDDDDDDDDDNEKKKKKKKKKKKSSKKNKKKNKEYNHHHHNERSSFSFPHNSYNSYNPSSSSPSNFIHCLLRSKIVPCSFIK